MKVRVELFGPLRDAADRGEAVMEVAPGTPLRDAVEGAYPGEISRGTALAVNGRLTRENPPLREGDVVALLPPVSGG